MSAERTAFRKIQVVLDYAKEGKHQDASTLGAYILDRQPSSFAYCWRDRRVDQLRRGYSCDSIDRAIQTCADLKLLSGDDLHLTDLGVSACDPGRFPTVVGRSAVAWFEQQGIGLSSVIGAIVASLRSDPPRTPTLDEIWARMGKPEDRIGEREFRQILTLLGQCGMIEMTQRRIFLPNSASLSLTER